MYEECEECKACGFGYVPSHKPDVKAHEKYHKAWLKACEKFGYILPSRERDKLRSLASELEDKGDPAGEMLHLWAMFCRSVRHNEFDIYHMSFPEYIEFMRSQNPRVTSIAPYRGRLWAKNRGRLYAKGKKGNE